MITPIGLIIQIKVPITIGTFLFLYLKMKKLDIFYDKIRANRHLNTFVILTRYLIGFAFIPSGFTKLMNHRFTQISTDNPIGFFFEGMYQSGFLWQFIGFMQIFAAFLLITQYFTTLGALIYFPMILSICLITIGLHFTGTWLITSLMLLACLLLLAWDYHKLKYLFYPDNFKLTTPGKHYPTTNKTWQIAGCILFAVSLGGPIISPYLPQTGMKMVLLWLLAHLIIVLSALAKNEWDYRKEKS